MAAGSIIIDLLMKTGSFETDTKRAEKALKQFQKQAEAAGKTIGAAIAAGVVGAAVAFDQLNKGAADFQDMAEMIGDSGENVASLAVAAATAGVGMESLTSASIKLTKGLTGVDDESKAAGAALAALGFNVKEFKQLNPVAQYEAVGKALSKFADGADKTAVAVALFGKSGAEQLKVFKALDEAGGRQVILTEAQIKAADAYADAQARSLAQLKLYAQAAATQALPAFNDLLEAASQLIKEFIGVDAATGKLSADNAVVAFAETAADAIAQVVEAVQILGLGFDVTGKAIGANAAIIGQVLEGNFKQALAIGEEARGQIAKQVGDFELFTVKLQKLRDASKAAAANPASYSNEGRAPTLTPLKFDGVADKQAAAKQSAADKYIESLKTQAQQVAELTTYEKLLDDISRGRLGKLTAGQQVVLQNLAVQIDATKQLAEQRKIDNEILSDSNKKVQENFESARKLAESVETPIETLNRELEELNRLTAENPFVTQETAARLSSEAFKKYAESVKKAGDETNTFAEQAASNIQDALGESTLAILKGDFDSIERLWMDLILRMVAQAAAADLGKRLLGADFGKSGNVGGWLGQIGKLFGGSSGAQLDLNNTGGYFADGGRPPVGKKSVVGERGPEWFQPNTAGRIIPNEALGVGNRTTQIITPPGMPMQVQESEQRQADGSMLTKLVLNTITQDAQNGGVAIKSQAAALGTSRKLVRRGR